MKLHHLMYIGLVLTSCSSSETQPEVASNPAVTSDVVLSAAQQKNAGITTAMAEITELSGLVRLNGKIEVPPQNLVSISVPMGGVLRETHLLEGMHIRKGEVIATLEDPQYIQLQQDFLIALSSLELAQGEFARQEELNKTKSASDKVFQQARAALQTQRIMVQSLSEKLRLLGIDPSRLTEANLSRNVLLRSPIDGFVSKVSVNIGKYVQPSEVLFELVNPADIHLALTVFEKDLESLSIGQTLQAYTNEHPEIKYSCKVLLIGKNLNNDRSTSVHCHFDRYDDRLIPGMYMNADVQYHNQKGVSVPTESVQVFEGKKYVFMEKSQGVYQMIPVETGIEYQGRVELLSTGVSLTNPVVVKGAYSILMQGQNKSDE